MVFNSHDWDIFCGELFSMRVIFELFTEKPTDKVSSQRNITSPSVQVIINEDQTVTVLSTHEQILDGQVYHVCEFPCHQDYRERLMRYGRQLVEFLAEKGVTDRFPVNFLSVPR